MKKLIYGSLFLALIGMVGCNKEAMVNENLEANQSSQSAKFDISLEEFQQILDSETSLEKAPPWVEKLKKWIKAHSGNSQQYVDGQPSCFGDGGCGPCAGICFGSGLIAGGDDGEITQEEFVLGLRSIAFSIFENKGNTSQRKMIIQIPSEYENEFIRGNAFVIDNDENLPSFNIISSAKILLLPSV